MVQTRNNPSGSEAEQADQLAAQITAILQQTLPGLFDQMRDELVQTLDQRIDAALTARSSGSGSTAQSQSRVVTYKDFMTCKPPFFEGQKDPVACYRWYSAVEGAFRTSGCPAGSKVLFAVNLLRNAAKDWWDLVLKGLSEAQITALTWEEFKVMFDEEFAPSIERERIAAEFLNLTQTTETVNEITAKFLEKLLFVPGYTNDESLKMARYLAVLKTEIKGAVTTKRCKTFSDMVETARAQEIHLEEKRQGKRKADDQSGPVKKYKGAKSDSKSEPAACSKCGRNHRGECRAQETSCFKCGKQGHFSRDCKEAAPAPATLRITDGTTTGKSGPITRGRAFQMTAEEAQAALDAITDSSMLYVRYRRLPCYLKACTVDNRGCGTVGADPESEWGELIVYDKEIGIVKDDIPLLDQEIYVKVYYVQLLYIEMDRNDWMYEIPRATQEYLAGLDEFMEAAKNYQLSSGENGIWCPCRKCRNFLKHSDHNVVKEHLVCHGFMHRYTCWIRHGEDFDDCNRMVDNECNDNNNDYESDNDICDNVDQMNKYVDLNECPICGTSRLKRMFANVKDAKLLRWHAEERKIDGKIRHGPKQPGNDIDVYLAPLIEDLKELWSPGVEVYDAYGKERFLLRAMIFCTINDFPAYGNLSGYNTKGEKACPNHHYRKLKSVFDGKTEYRVARQPLNGRSVYSRVEDLDIVFGKGRPAPPKNIWKKKSIFWDLPYWEHLTIRHCLDVMHIEKNVCDSLIGLLLNIPGKSKDGVKVRKDMVEMGIRSELAPVDNGKRTYLPPACYTLSKAKKTRFCQCLHGIKVPSGYSANIKKLVSMKDLKLLGYVRNRSRPEGSIVEGYASEEVIDFCTDYLTGVKNIGIPQFDMNNMTAVAPHVHEHMSMLHRMYQSKSDKWLATEHNRTFSRWLKERVRPSHGENQLIKSRTFATTTEFSRANNDARSRIAKDSYYGVIQEIWELDYTFFKIPLFKCKWVENQRGVKVDNDGFTLVYLSREGYVSEPFILAKQASQVFFVEDPKDSKFGTSSSMDDDDFFYDDELNIELGNDNEEASGLEVKSRFSILTTDWHKADKADKEGCGCQSSDRAKMNKNPHHLRSRGYLGKFDGWDKLKEKGPDEYVLPKHTQSLADKLIQKDRQISQGDGDLELGDDPLVAVLGPEHPGRTRGVGHNVGLRVGLGLGDKKRKQKEKANLEEEITKAVRLAMQQKESEWEERREQDKREWEERMERDRRTWQENTQNLQQQLKMALAGQLGRNNVSPDGSPGVHKSSAGSTACAPQMLSIECATPCNLVVYCRKAKVVVANGMTYPLVDSVVYGVPLQDGFIKVLVDLVINGWEDFELPVPLPNDGIETLGQALGKFIQWEQEYVVLQQAPSTNKNPLVHDMMPSSSAPKSVFLPQVPPKSAHIPHQVQKEDEAQSKRVVVETELGSKKQAVKKLKHLPKEIQNRPTVMKDLFRRLRSNAEWVVNGVTVQIDVEVFGPTRIDELKCMEELALVSRRKLC
ncbi:hypothetical protein OSB04_016631 [Centaurea solstitialis]|uniref:CCHC-type domain-containing protein n=1 Tax=Centaurea solstitialis TaxID=347529 RepID=A0AA38TEJ6_9ASTR|nr:hypothetical protein OSB04_016631 [Centaurea solstitialis]